MLEPSAERYEHQQHGGRLKESAWTCVLLERHGHQEGNDRVGVGDGGGERNEDVHVGRAVHDRLLCMDVEVLASNELKHQSYTFSCVLFLCAVISC